MKPMIKKYFYILLFIFSFSSFCATAQDLKGSSDFGKNQEQPNLEGLSIYPNPTNSGKIFISSKSLAEKKIEIFDVLGKRVLETITSNKEVNVSILKPGVYIIKVKEGDASVTRKLIIN
ncbi:Por secretion system C-terminal sorting domain-containing protein [Flavobacterium haoranii]|uniref:Por secretion system C-terminal sorting domain-containing protein n=2 Tax=Flavobacterium haoranii TaxID=683124 RepID=A0A1M6FCL5_9FLAO|nr:Por secretion system C-terminal sorting domain-containing protein [Flavobacterium haoranii]